MGWEISFIKLLFCSIWNSWPAPSHSTLDLHSAAPYWVGISFESEFGPLNNVAQSSAWGSVYDRSIRLPVAVLAFGVGREAEGNSAPGSKSLSLGDNRLNANVAGKKKQSGF